MRPFINNLRGGILELIKNLDNEILYYIIENWRNSVTNVFFVFISTLGNKGFIWIASAVIMLFSKKWRSCGIIMLLSLGVGAVLGSAVIKNVICRPRPFAADPSITLLTGLPGGVYSFPSGHSNAAGAAAMVLSLKDRKAGIWAWVFALLMAFSRVFLAVHYPSDVISGLAFGALCAAVVWKLCCERTERCLERIYERSEIK